MNTKSLVNEHDERIERFVEYLEKLEREGNRAALAALRRSLGQPIGLAGEAHRHVLWSNPSIREEADFYLIAGLFALHPQHWRQNEEEKRSSNFGASFARLQAAVDSSSIEKRFVALLNSHEDDLAEQLRHAVSLLKSKDIPVDWVQLLRDLRGWRSESRFVQRRWARAFWGGAHPEDGSPLISTSKIN